jgi:prepilin-type N-terminal cleavage/methylation domain-containing protein
MSAHFAAKRRGFSLLEMVIALSLGVILLLALYVTLSNTVQLAQTGREVMADGATARSIMSRINNDIVNQLGPIDPRMFPDASTASSDADSSDTTSSTPALPAATPVAYNVGVKGDATWLQLSVYRVQRTPPGQATDSPDPVVISDLVRINYWLIGETPNIVGLARQEIKQATSPDIDLTPKDIPDANKYLIADEVKNILFEYYDGTTWQQSWDGSDTSGSLDGSPLGPPAAIRITVTLRRNTQKTQTVSDAPDDATNTYVHVVALPTSNNPAPKTSTTTAP